MYIFYQCRIFFYYYYSLSGILFLQQKEFSITLDAILHNILLYVRNDDCYPHATLIYNYDLYSIESYLIMSLEIFILYHIIQLITIIIVKFNHTMCIHNKCEGGFAISTITPIVPKQYSYSIFFF